MKPSTKLKKARVHYDKATELIDSLREKIIGILGDDCAHISFSTDGLVIVSNGGMDNTPVEAIDIDSFLKLTSKKEAVEILNSNSI